MTISTDEVTTIKCRFTPQDLDYSKDLQLTVTIDTAIRTLTIKCVTGCRGKPHTYICRWDNQADFLRGISDRDGDYYLRRLSGDFPYGFPLRNDMIAIAINTLRTLPAYQSLSDTRRAVLEREIEKYGEESYAERYYFYIIHGIRFTMAKYKFADEDTHKLITAVESKGLVVCRVIRLFMDYVQPYIRENLIG